MSDEVLERIFVVKKDGRQEDFKLGKIFRRIKAVCFNLNRNYVSPDLVIDNLMDNLPNVISSSDLDSLIAKTAAKMGFHHPDYLALAARIEISNLHKTIRNVFSEVTDWLYQNGKEQANGDNPVISQKYHSVVMENARRLDSAIKFENDYYFDYLAIKILKHSYLFKIDGNIVECPQHLLMRVAITIHGNDISSAIETYMLMSQKMFIHDSPSLLFSGTVKPQLCSSFALKTKDGMEDILECLSKCATISKLSGNTSINVSEFRSKDSYVAEHDLHYNGLVSVLRLFNDTFNNIQQNKIIKKPGPFTIYIEPWHPDIYEFLELAEKSVTGGKDLLYALSIPNLFFVRICSNEPWSLMCPKKSPGLSNCYGTNFEMLYRRYENECRYLRKVMALELWKTINDIQLKTGSLFIMYKDNFHNKTNHKQFRISTRNKFSIETDQFTSLNEVDSRNMASIAVNRFVDQQANGVCYMDLRRVTRVLVRNLNKIIDSNFYPSYETKYSSLRNRAIAIGIHGLADTFAMLGLAFDSPRVRVINILIFETIYYSALEESCSLAQKHGRYETYKDSAIDEGILQFDMWNGKTTGIWDWDSLKKKISQFGVRNSVLLELMPTTEASQILGNNESIEPFVTNLYKVNLFGEEFLMVNSYLVYDLVKEGIWNKSIKNQIREHHGSIQGIADIPRYYKQVYKSAWEISFEAICILAAERAPFIDQNQYLTFYQLHSSVQALSDSQLTCWQRGLKSGMYKLNIKSGEIYTKIISDQSNCSRNDPSANESNVTRRKQINLSNLFSSSDKI